MSYVVVVDRRADFKWAKDGLQIITTRDFIATPEATRPKAPRVINLSRDYAYLGFGYYCSLLAEARGNKVIPTVRTLLDLSQKSLYRFALPELEARVRALTRRGTGQATRIEYGVLSYDQAERVVKVHGQLVDLSAREMAVLEVLLLRLPVHDSAF